MYNYIIFDIDGTILDTKYADLTALQKVVFEELNKYMSFDELKFALGIPGEVTLKKLGINNISDCIDRWNFYIHENFNQVKVFNNIKETLVSLNKMGIRTGIVTSKTRKAFLDDFAPFELAQYFQIVVCADDTEKYKPDPEPILKLIELAGIDKSKAIYIGDTAYDMECAYGAGIDFALALWGATTALGIKANYILQDPKEILKLI